MLDAKYKKANLKEITTTLKFSNSDEQLFIYGLLKKHEIMFDGSLINDTVSDYKIELLEQA